MRLNFIYSSLDFYGVALMRLAIVRGDGKAFPLQHYPTYASKLFVKLLFRSVDNGHQLSGHLFPQPTRPGDVKAMAPRVNDPADIYAVANVVQVAATENCDGHFGRESAQDHPC